jgi:hypothetical protein
MPEGKEAENIEMVPPTKEQEEEDKKRQARIEETAFKPAPEAKVTGQPSEPAKEGKKEDKAEKDYESLTVAELKDEADKRGVQVDSHATKAEIIKALQKADKK